MGHSSKGKWICLFYTQKADRGVIYPAAPPRVQVVIDRRFFRQEYNAEQALENFVDTARNLSRVDELAGEVVQVAQQTLKPESINLWLKKTQSDRFS